MLQIAKANQRECYSGLAAAFGYIERIEPQEDPDIDVVVLREKTRRAVRKAMRAIGVKFQRVKPTPRHSKDVANDEDAHGANPIRVHPEESNDRRSKKR